MGIIPQTDDRLYFLMGFLSNSVLIAGVVVVGVMIVCLWRVWKRAIQYLVLLSLILISVVLDLVWWIIAFQTVQPEGHKAAAVKIVLTLASAAYFVVLLILCVNWVFAFFFLSGRDLPARAERIAQVAVFGCAGVLLALTIGVGIAYLMTVNQLSGWIAEVGFVVLESIVVTLSLVMAMFLVVSSITGVFLLKRRVAPVSQISALVRFASVCLVLLVVLSLRTVRFFATQMLNFYWLLPDWFNLGIVRLVGDFAIGVALLYLVLTASYGMRIAGSNFSGVDAGEELLDVPKTYEV